MPWHQTKAVCKVAVHEFMSILIMQGVKGMVVTTGTGNIANSSIAKKSVVETPTLPLS